MIAIADKLNGKVQGDDGESYDKNYFANKPKGFGTDTTNRAIKKPWWKFWVHEI